MTSSGDRVWSRLSLGSAGSVIFPLSQGAPCLVPRTWSQLHSDKTVFDLILFLWWTFLQVWIHFFFFFFANMNYILLRRSRTKFKQSFLCWLNPIMEYAHVNISIMWAPSFSKGEPSESLFLGKDNVIFWNLQSKRFTINVSDNHQPKNRWWRQWNGWDVYGVFFCVHDIQLSAILWALCPISRSLFHRIVLANFSMRSVTRSPTRPNHCIPIGALLFIHSPRVFFFYSLIVRCGSSGLPLSLRRGCVAIWFLLPLTLGEPLTLYSLVSIGWWWGAG